MLDNDCTEWPFSNIGPQTNLDPSTIISERAAMLFNINTMPNNPSCLRQLTSAFHHHSTCAFLRATLDDFDDIRLVLATVFTLWWYPELWRLWFKCTICSEARVSALAEVLHGLPQKAEPFFGWPVGFPQRLFTLLSRKETNLVQVVAEIEKYYPNGNPCIAAKYNLRKVVCDR